MPEKKTLERAKKAKKEGKSPNTQAGEFVREEMHHMQEGKPGVHSKKQAIAIGLSKARQSGIHLDQPSKSSHSKKNMKNTKTKEKTHTTKSSKRRKLDK